MGFCKNHYRYHCIHHVITSPCHWAKNPHILRAALTVSSLNALQTFLLWKQPTHRCSVQSLSSLPSPHATLFFFSLISPWFLCSGFLLLTSSSVLCHLPRWEEQNTHKNIPPHTDTDTGTLTETGTHKTCADRPAARSILARGNKGLQEWSWKQGEWKNIRKIFSWSGDSSENLLENEWQLSHTHTHTHTFRTQTSNVLFLYFQAPFYIIYCASFNS